MSNEACRIKSLYARFVATSKASCQSRPVCSGRHNDKRCEAQQVISYRMISCLACITKPETHIQLDYTMNKPTILPCTFSQCILDSFATVPFNLFQPSPQFTQLCNLIRTQFPNFPPPLQYPLQSTFTEPSSQTTTSLDQPIGRYGKTHSDPHYPHRTPHP